MLYSHIIHIYTYIHANAWRRNEDERTQFFRKIYLSLYLKGLCVRGSWRPNKDCNILSSTLMAITAFLSRSPGLLNRGPGGPASLGHGPHSSIFSPTDWTSCRQGYIIIWRPLFFLRASQFRTQFNPSTVKVISWYSSTGCTCYLHRCIS